MSKDTKIEVETGVTLDTSTAIKKRLDEVDANLANKVAKTIFDSKLRILTSQFEKGKIIAGEFRGVNSPSYRKLERETGRDHKTLKKWHDLFRQYRIKISFIQDYAYPKAEKWTTKLLSTPPPKQLPDPNKPINITPVIPLAAQSITLLNLHADVRKMETKEEIVLHLQSEIQRNDKNAGHTPTQFKPISSDSKGSPDVRKPTTEPPVRSHLTELRQSRLSLSPGQLFSQFSGYPAILRELQTLLYGVDESKLENSQEQMVDIIEHYSKCVTAFHQMLDNIGIEYPE